MMNLNELAKEKNDPEKRETLIQKLTPHVKVLTDECGNDYKLVRICDLNLPLDGFIKDDKVMFRDIKTTALRDDDVMLLNYPKTGSHWITNLIYFLYQSGPLEEIVSVSQVLLDLAPEAIVAAKQSPRLLNTHYPPDMVPQDTFKTCRKVVFLCRNPKDTAVSLYHHLVKDKSLSDDMEISWNCFIENWMQGFILVMSYFRYHKLWQDFLEDHKEADVLVVHYEDLRQDGLKGLRRLQKHLGFNHSDERLLEILNRCSLNSLKHDVESKKLETKLLDKDGHPFVFRKGIIGDWKNHFTVAQNEQMDAIIAEEFRNSIFYWHD